MVRTKQPNKEKNSFAFDTGRLVALNYMNSKEKDETQKGTITRSDGKKVLVSIPDKNDDADAEGRGRQRAENHIASRLCNLGIKVKNDDWYRVPSQIRFVQEVAKTQYGKVISVEQAKVIYEDAKSQGRDIYDALKLSFKTLL